MKMCTIIAMAALGVSSVFGDQLIDDFNRADTAYSTNGALIGAEWSTSDSGGTGEQWRVHSNQLECDITDASTQSFLYNTAVVLDTNFTYSADVKLLSAYGGIVFHYQDADNYYAARIRGYGGVYQILRVVDGGTHTVINEITAAEDKFVGNQYYTITVTSDNAYNFTLEITKTGESKVLNSVTNATDLGVAFTGGYAGLYSASYNAVPDTKFDNFNLTIMSDVIPGYVRWAAGWGVVDIGVEGEDYDKDGLSNVYEYGLDGDPTNALVQGVSPEFAIVDAGGSNVFHYVHPQLSNPSSGLDYHLELTDDLAGGAWTNAGYAVTGTNVTGSTLDFVTNVIDTADSSKFIHLIIESL